MKTSLSLKPITNPSADHFQYHGILLHVILEVMYVLDEVWGQDY